MKCQLWRGPLGLWPWPIVNILLALACRLMQGQHADEQSTQEARSQGPVRVYQLVRDEKGRIVEVVEAVGGVERG